MKKGLVFFIVLLLIIVGSAWYLLSGAGDFIRAQIEQQGSKYLGTTVSLAKVDLALTDARLSMSALNIKNPQGYSDENAFSVDSITLDLGEVINEPFVVQTFSIDAPTFLYEVDAKGKGNLLALKNHLQANLPKTTNEPATTKDGANPLVIIENVTVSNVRLKVNFEKLPTGDVELETKTYEVTLPTFHAGPIGQPNGLPADKVGVAVVNAMLDNVIASAKAEAKKRLTEAAKKKAKEKIDEKKDELVDKAKDKLKGLFD